MKKKSPRKMRGAIPWGWLATIAIIAAGAALAFVFFPKPAAKSPPPAVVRAKVPTVPPPPVTPPSEAADENRQPAREDASPTDEGNDQASQHTSVPQTNDKMASATADESVGTITGPAKPDGAIAPDQTSKLPTIAAAAVQPEEGNRPPSSDARSDPAPVKAASSTTADEAETEQAQTPQEPAGREKPSPAAQSQPPREQPPVSATAAEPKAADRGYAIQVGAYRNKVYADAQVNKMKQRGYDAYIYEVTDAQQRSFYMVRFGTFATREAAAESVAGFREKEKMAAVIVRSGAM